MSKADSNDADDVPLHHMKPFGSTLRRKEIRFVPAADEGSEALEEANLKSSGQSISDLYLNMVLKQPGPVTQDLSQGEATEVEACEICHLPRTHTPATRSHSGGSGFSHHEASIAHQCCLTHSHPPSAVDRNRIGLSILEAAGWDPDARTGLGAEGQGVQFPIKPKPKDDTVGVGVVVPKDFAKREKEKPKLLDAKRVRKMAAEDRRKTDRLQQQIFGKVDLERYLGKNA